MQSKEEKKTLPMFTGQVRTREESDQEGWMVAYADMITLLFIFFTLLLSISTINTSKFDMIRSEYSQEKSASLSSIAKEFKAQVEAKKMEESVSIDLSSEGLRVSFSEQVLFPTGEATLNAEGIEDMTGVASVLKGMNSKYRIAIEGHTDSRPIKTKEFSSNWSLSSARAVNVLHNLSQLQVSDRAMSIRAFADTRPVETKDANTVTSDERMKKSRRVSLLIY